MSSSLAGKTVLVVDDDRELVAALSALLEETGATVETAGDGNAALEAASQYDPDLVLLDAMLPKRSGFLVLEKLKSNGKKRGQRPFVIMITGNEGKRHQAWAQSLGVDDYLNKPFRMDRLMQCIDKLFGSEVKS